MIKVNHGNVEVKGSCAELFSDLTTAIKHIKIAFVKNGYSEEEVNLVIADAVRVADMSPKEVLNEIFEKLSELLDSEL